MVHTIQIQRVRSVLRAAIFTSWILSINVQSVFAQDLDSDNDGIPDSYERGMGDFSFDNIFNIGTANNSAVELNNDEIQLTQDQTSLRGSAMSIGKIDFQYDFSFSVQAYFGVNNGIDGSTNTGADGIAAVFHNDPAGSNVIGNDGEGMGAQGIQHGIVLEVDTYGNGNTGAQDPLRGIDDDHMDIWDSDDNARATLIGGYILYRNGGDTDVEDGEYHEVVFSWVASTGTLSFTIDGLNGGSVSTGSAQSFVNTYFNGSFTAHFGFTASTGGSRNEHRVYIDNISKLPLVLDSDNDGIYDHLDLDSDNDGIYDAEEAGHGAPHTNGIVDGGDAGGDGIPDAVQNDPGSGQINYVVGDMDGDGVYNHQEVDADDDGCFDTKETSFEDEDNDGIVGTGTPTVNSNGVVIGITIGYSDPTSEYLNNTINRCTPYTDLGDEGDGDDAFVTYVEDSPAVDLLANATIVDVDDTSLRSFQIAVSGLTDGNNEVLIIGGVQFPLNTSIVTPTTLIINGVSIQVTYINNVFNFTSATGVLAIDLLEDLLNGLGYLHLDQIDPTDGNRLLSVSVGDGTNTSPVNTITIDVDPVNDAPRADDEGLNLDEGATASVNVIEGDEDLDGELDLGSITIQTFPMYGTLTVNLDGTIAYEHDDSNTTIDSFTYTIDDNEGASSNEAVVSVTIYPIDDEQDPENTLPNPEDDFITLNAGDTLLITSSLGVLSNDSDPDGDELVVVGFTIEGTFYPAGDTVELDEGSFILNADGSYSYITTADFSGQLPEIVYTVSDGTATENATLLITVVPKSTAEEIPIETSLLITNNGDQMNDAFQILGIEAYPNNQVLIFNRWGNKVWEKNGYDNKDSIKRFTGISNVNVGATELPDGTYYYVINKGDGSLPIKGFVVLKN